MRWLGSSVYEMALKRIEEERWWPPMLMLGGLLETDDRPGTTDDSYGRFVRMILVRGSENAIVLAVGVLCTSERQNDGLKGEVSSALSNSLKNGVKPAHKRAAKALAEKIGNDYVAERLAELLSASMPATVKQGVAEILGEIKGRKALELVKGALSDSREDKRVRGASARALGRIGGKAAVEALTAALQDDDRHVQVSAEIALGRMFEFETVTLDEDGNVSSRATGAAHHFLEHLAQGVILEMVEIPRGTFTMGSPEEEEGSRDVERPQHEVTVSPFYIGKFTITQAQWRVVAGWPKVNMDLNADPSGFKGDDRPVERVSWEDAAEFCARLSRKTGKEYRLPTEAEWEYACRAGTRTPFAFGETITPEFVNYNGNYPYGKAANGKYREETIPVGSLGVANGWGLYDMHGNVWAWCQDWAGPYQPEPVTDPAGPLEGEYRRLRGGSWYVNAFLCRSAYRVDLVPGFRDSYFGFRVVVVSRTP